MSEHTPGPWEFDSGNIGSCYGRPYYGIITNTDYSVFINVGAVADDYRGSHGRGDECEANARLIAAAPDLLVERERLYEAAIAYQELAACYRIGKRPTKRLFARLERARAALQEDGND